MLAFAPTRSRLPLDVQSLQRLPTMRSHIRIMEEILDWDPASGDMPVVSGRHLNWKEGGVLYRARVTEEDFNDASFSADAVQGELTPRELYHIKYDPTWNWTLASGPVEEHQYVKGEPFIFCPKDTDESSHARGFTNDRKAEIAILEALKAHPHPNIVKYYGVLLEDGWVTGIVLEKLGRSLAEILETASGSYDFDVDKVLDEVQAGLDHLHANGIMHGDVSHSNICLGASGTAVLIDFDSAALLGSPRPGKLTNFIWGVEQELETLLVGRPKTGDVSDACIEIDVECFKRTKDRILELTARKRNSAASGAASARQKRKKTTKLEGGMKRTAQSRKKKKEGSEEGSISEPAVLSTTQASS